METNTERRPEAVGAEPARAEAPRNSAVPAPPAGGALEELCELAALACGASAALLCLAEPGPARVRASYGLAGRAEGPRLLALAARAALGREEAVLAEGAGEFLACATAPLPAGALCVLDARAREFTPAQRRALALAARRAEALLRAEAPAPNPAPAHAEGELLLHADPGLTVTWASPAASALLAPNGPPLEGAALWSRLAWPAPAPGRGWAGSAHARLRLGGASYQACLHPAPGGYALHLRRDEAASRPDEALRRRGELLSALLHAAPEAVYAKDLEGRYAFVNLAAAEHLGRGPEEALGRTDEQLFGRGEAPAVARLDAQVLRDGRTRSYDAPAAGRAWRATKGLLRDGAGRAVGLYGVLRDLTRPAAAEAALQASEERLRLALEVARLGLWDWTVEAGELRWAQAEQRLFGLPPGAAGGTHRAFLELVDPADRPAVEAAFARALTEGREFSVEFRLRAGAGPATWLLGWGRPLRTPAGEVGRILGVVGDITPRKQEEEQGRRVAHFQEQLLGIVGHDLRSPLAAIRIWAQLLGRGGLAGDRLPRAAEAILRSTARMDRMITDLLDLNRSRLGAGIPVVAQAADIHQICTQVVEEQRVAHANRKVSLVTEGGGAGRWDADRLTQVVSNLVTNALEYSPPDSEVEVHSRGGDGQVVVAVRNQGRPIPPELLPILFEPYRRGAEAEHAGTRNLGLGLYIARQLVEAHGGRIEVESGPAGTVFTVRLPRGARAEPGPAP